MEFERKINIGHIIVAASLLVSIVLYTANIRTEIAAEEHARALSEAALGSQIQGNTSQIRRVSEILDDLEARVRMNDEHRVRDEARTKDF